MPAKSGYRSSSSWTSWISKKLSDSDDTAERGDASPVPSTPSPAPAYSESPMNLTSMVDNEGLKSLEQVPTVDHCVVHLALMDAFARLREEVSSRDGLFGIPDDLAKSARPWITGQPPSERLLGLIREKRWAVYVCRAVYRFERWWDASLDKIPNGESRGRLRQRDLAYNSGFDIFSPQDMSERVRFTPNVLPPLDVLMVWHAFMLNPRDYLEDCLRYGRMRLWGTGMPWAAIHSSIDGVHLRYDPGLEAQDLFRLTTSLAWDNLDDPIQRTVACPACPFTWVDCQWTASNLSKVSSPSRSARKDGDPTADLTAAFASGKGYADLGFRQHCPKCTKVITHDTLRGDKFRLDVEKLLQHDYPMPGTVLNIDGMPEKAIKRLSLEVMPMLRPNRLLLDGLGSQILKGKFAKVDSIRQLIEGEISSRTLLRPERIAVRKMMSHYWDNSSPFALDLVGAVVRQGVFVQKMRKIDWLRSPALPSTMQRLLIKYERFFSIMATKPGYVAVPTLDVDLGWHTHQLSPRTYYTYSFKRTNKFIDHNDKIDENKLSKAFEWTSKRYQRMFKEVYSECTCWYCEATRESHRTPLSVTIGSARAADAKFYGSRAADECDPAKQIHISAHNAVPAKGATTESSDTYRDLQRLWERAAVSACEGRRRAPDPRNDSAAGLSWGITPHPYYGPYMGDRCSQAAYPVFPGCMTFIAGAPGNCVAGACGGSVAAGNCGGTDGGGACGGGGDAGGASCGDGGGGGGGGGGCGGCGGGGCGG